MRRARGSSLTLGFVLSCAAFAALVSAAWSAPLDARWDEGAADCGAQQPAVEVHRYNEQTFILRETLCTSFEAPFSYLLVGSEKALLIDTGASGEAPLAREIRNLLPGGANGSFPLIVAHTHGHADHRAGDAQFGVLPSAVVAPTEGAAMYAFYRFTDWPNDVANLDLGGRIVDIIPTPGHDPFHLAFYDRTNGLLFSGDFLLPGRLIIEDVAAYRRSAQRVAGFLRTRPLAHVLGAHIELSASGALYPFGSQHHPGERALELGRENLAALPAAFASFNGFYARHGDFALTNPRNNLIALASAGAVVLALIVFVVRALLRARKRQRAAASA